MNKRVVAVTLGSNGFHLRDVERSDQSLITHKHLYTAIQAESYVDETGAISTFGIGHILLALRQFADYLKPVSGAMRAGIATGTFRRAKNMEKTMTLVERTLGFPVRVLSAEEESLLCCLGIASIRGVASDNRLIFDIGGGSTEIILLKQDQLLQHCSLDIGCISLTEKVFTEGSITAAGVNNAIDLVAAQVTPVVDNFKHRGWQEVIGCGGTVSSLSGLLQRNRFGGRFITPASLARFTEAVVEKGSARPLGDDQLADQRARILPAGSAILMAILQAMEIDRLEPVLSSVGQGLVIKLLYDD